ncbi:serine/threonine-protein kinase [Anaeromyxobacter sp. Fw109-5]|uniref:serine/threonine-protein kinase n=1 Tax=Anaeromyxobacter sp. (strain Fw109-5) TaxID=404589 RepID=UPI0000ED7E58|nr:serine/threonine-protein kinase [Anaeromyxobacter sp. Fw109-5]ABS25640.1 protein kinase [Anaeromyxobacter sp. Fw109-5]
MELGSEDAERSGRRTGGGIAHGTVTALLAAIAAAPDDGGHDASSLVPGTSVGRFQVLRELGTGGFGVVYEARDEALGRRVALKMLRPDRSRGAPEARWLVEEAEAAAQLQHPNIVALHDLGMYRGQPYLVFELLTGETLERRLRRGPLPPREALRIALGVASAVAHAHRHGVMHRDLKPGNVFLTDEGSVKVLDFGLAQLVGAEAKRGGTPAYVAPEQWRGEPEDARADVFALGVMLHEMIRGTLPHRRDGGAGGTERSRAGVPNDVPRTLAGVVERMIAPAAEDRLPDFRSVQAALTAVEGHATRRRQRRLALLALGALTVLAMAFSSRWGGDALPTGDVVALAVADVSNETDHAEVDAVSGLLITSLEQSRRLRVMTRSRMLDLLGREGDEGGLELDVTTSLAVARRAGARILLTPVFRRANGGYALVLEARDSVRNLRLFSEVAYARHVQDVPALVDELGARIRVRLGEPRDEIARSSVRVAQSVTPSLAAYALYACARDERWGRLDSTRLRSLLERALTIDPRFALARLELALIESDGTLARAAIRDMMSRVMDGAGVLPERERLLARAFDARMRLDLDGALALYREAIARFPEEKEAYLEAATMLWLDGGFRPEAVPLVEQALRLDPHDRRTRRLHYRLLCGAGRCDEALALAREGVAHVASYSDLRLLYSVHLWRGDREALLDVGRRIAAIHETVPWQSHYPIAAALWANDDYAGADEVVASVADAPPLVLAFMRVAEGRWAEARRVLKGDWSSGYRVPDAAARHVFLLGGIATPEQHRAAARRHCREMEDQCGLTALSGLLAGDVELARESVRATPLPSAAWYRAFVDAWDQLHAGNAVAAVARARAVAKRDVVQGATAAYLTADLCFAAGDWRCALEGYAASRRALADPAPFIHAFLAWTYPRSILRTALAHARLGERDEARAEVERLLSLWRGADADLPMLQEALALRAQLARR